MMQAERPSIYQIRVQGKLNEQWSDWLAGVTIRYDHAHGEIPISTLTSPVMDQAALRGIVTKLWDLNMTLLSINRLDDRR